MHRAAQWKQGVTFPNGWKKPTWHERCTLHRVLNVQDSTATYRHTPDSGLQHLPSPETTPSYPGSSAPLLQRQATTVHFLCIYPGGLFLAHLLSLVHGWCPSVPYGARGGAVLWKQQNTRSRKPCALQTAILRITGLVGKMGLMAGYANPVELGKQGTSKRHWGDLVDNNTGRYRWLQADTAGNVHAQSSRLAGLASPARS